MIVPALARSTGAAPSTKPRTAPTATPAPGPAPVSVGALTPTQALQLLRDGNARFVSGHPVTDQIDGKRRLEIAKTQKPFVAYVSCSDSRVPPELLFGRGLGEMFIIRNAGNTVDTIAMGSIEFAVAELGVPLVVVMGHERCGAVKAAVSVVENNTMFPGSIGKMIEPIIPAVLRAKSQRGNLLDNSVRENVRRVTHQLRTAAEPMLLAPQQQGKLQVVGAYYDLDTGKVDFFDEPPTKKG
ncbi:MAG: carbonic anhydrase [Deltaproteobacteria bacterium]|nr:carbonic anhydrase [Deltaproteobacteria bacterium]